MIALPAALLPLINRVPPLGPGSPNQAVHATLAALTLQDVVPNFKHRPHAEACLAGLWLLHDFLDESHQISQEIHTPSGSFWHGMMHRREPDAWNSKYWFQKVGTHPVFKLLSQQAPSVGYTYRGSAAFVDDCETARDTGRPEEEVARQVQYLEWQLLFEHCYQAAITG